VQVSRVWVLMVVSESISKIVRDESIQYSSGGWAEGATKGGIDLVWCGWVRGVMGL
jgi:hypothetical protein